MRADNIKLLYYTNNSALYQFSKAASVNRLYRNRAGRVKPYSIHSKVYLDILSQHHGLIDHKFLQCDAYVVNYCLICGDKKRRDLSNHIKLFEDITFRLLIKDDDSKAKHITMLSAYIPRIKKKYMYITWHCTTSDTMQESTKQWIDEISRFLI